MEILIFFIAHWYLSLFTQTFFHHRYAAHGQFEMSKGWEKFWYILSLVFQGSSYLSPYIYGMLHRMHHAYADTEKDPHSPKYSKNLFDMMWKTKLIYSDLLSGRKVPDEQFRGNLPYWESMEKFADHKAVRTFWIVAYIAFYAVFAEYWWMWLLLPIHFVMGPFHGAIINWFAHKLGYVRYKLKDTSKNLLPVDFLMLGESYHNNHHSHPNSANFGKSNYELDPVYFFIVLFDKVNMIKLKEQPDPVKVKSNASTTASS